MATNSHTDRLEVSTIIRKNLEKVSIESYSPDKQKVLSALTKCRTPELGGHLTYCTSCDYREQSYNSCFNRHCPKCKGGRIFSWVESRKEELLDVPYFHLVFTIPQELRPLFYQNKKLCYDLLFKASSETLNLVAEQRFGAKLGYIEVLHTWNQELLYHPHLHNIVPALGITHDGVKQLGSEKFFMPVRVLSKIYQGKLIWYIKKAYRENQLKFFGNETYLQNPLDFEHLISKATKTDWVVYAKRPFAGPETVIKYLSCYTHRVGISNSRLREITDNTVSFSARDKLNKSKKKLVTITHQEFVKRFLLHLLPKSYQRIRHYGFLSNTQRAHTLSHILSTFRRIIPQEAYTTTPTTCPNCLKPTLKRAELTKPHRKYPLIPSPLLIPNNKAPPIPLPI